MVGRTATAAANAAHFNLRPVHEEDFDEEGQTFAFDAGVSARRAPQAIQRKGALAAQAMSLSALVLALISVCLLSMVAFRLGGGSGSVQPELRDVIGLASEGVAEADDDGRGWYRTYLRTMVREGESLDSAQVKLLSPGSLVWVAETKGRRARILQPVKGWMSLRSTEGIEIMRPDITFSGKMNETQATDLFRSEEMKNATKRLKAASAKLTALQDKMRQRIDELTGKETFKKVRQKSKEVGQVVQKKAPLLEKLAAQELKKVVNPKGTSEFFKSLEKKPGMKEISEGAEADAMAMQDMQRIQSSIEGSIDSTSAKAESSADHVASTVDATSDGDFHA
mmetsp:Transcript_127726/g.331085  ORF Transcript_127726/g.331085 Transcript_127726/m.331085 type:complete len:338 (+) Transcript_127726:110-1123(+)